MGTPSRLTSLGRHGAAALAAALVVTSAHAAPDADLVAAARAGRADAVHAALKGGASPDTRADGHRPVLVLAAASGDLATVEALLAAGADPKLQDATWTPLLMAVLHAREEVVDRLLRAGAPPNAWDARQTTPLMLASGLGHEAIVKRLLAADGIWVEARDLAGATALHYAANNGHVGVVRLLQPRLADAADRNGNSALALARRNGHKDVVAALEGAAPAQVE